MAAPKTAINIVEPNFDVDDIVVVRRASDDNQKLLFKCYGELRFDNIVSCLVYRISIFDEWSAQRYMSRDLLDAVHR